MEVKLKHLVNQKYSIKHTEMKDIPPRIIQCEMLLRSFQHTNSDDSRNFKLLMQGKQSFLTKVSKFLNLMTDSAGNVAIQKTLIKVRLILFLNVYFKAS